MRLRHFGARARKANGDAPRHDLHASLVSALAAANWRTLERLMLRRALLATVTVVVTGALLGGCRSRGSITSDKPEQLPAPAKALPPIKSGQAMTTAQISVLVARDTVTVGENIVAPVPSDATHGFDAKYKRNGPTDLYVVPIANVIQYERDKLDAGPSSHEARLAVDGSTPYRALVEVLFTLGQNEIDTFKLVAPSAGGRVPKDGPAEIVAHAPRASGMQIATLTAQASAMQLEMLKALAGDDAGVAVPKHAPAPTPAPIPMPSDRPTLGLLIIVVNDGIAIKARGGNVAPGCNDVGAGLSIPKTADGRYDYASLAACVVKLKAAAPEFKDERSVTVSANPNVPYSIVLQTVDAVRGENADVFPDVAFGIAR
jgi:biopolymer transport protein ExbD